MKKISDIDKNFRIEKHRDFGDVVFYDPEKPPFAVYGVFREGKKFRRMPESTAARVNDGVKYLHANTAGGRIRFRTDSPFVAIRVTYGSVGKMPHFALSGSAGFDLYEFDGKKSVYLGTYMPPWDVKNKYEGIVHTGLSGEHDLLINMPTYSEVETIEIGLKPGSVISSAPSYSVSEPVVYYGSSITQGGCVSRPGSTYQALLSARFDADYINLGFSGSAKAEPEMADYIAGLDMSVFVYDYDHNAPTPEHLEQTHEKLFLRFRESHPETPVIMMTRPKAILNEDERFRRSIVENTYRKAAAAGDENVYFVDGEALTASVGCEGTVDNSHPTDNGFFSMAKALTPVFAAVFEKKGKDQ